MTEDQWARLILAFAPALSGVLASRRLLHDFQLESYQFMGFFRTLRRKGLDAWLPGLMLAGWSVLVFIALGLLTKGEPALWSAACAFVLIVCAGLWLLRSSRRAKEKKPFRATARVKRQCVGLTIVMAALGAALYAWTPVFLAPAFAPALLPVFVTLAMLLCWPVENLIKGMYFRDARKRLMAQKGLIRIGITGSYGKTSVKFILSGILSERYNVLHTPTSLNTPMGVTTVIRGKLRPEHQVFIAEMGARHVGDIKELCRLVTPAFGVITSIGPQHLETFRTQERIRKTKMELIDALPGDGVAFFANDGNIVTQCWRDTQKPKRLSGTDAGDAWAENVRVTTEGSAFTLCLRGQSPVQCETRLLGAHNIGNIVLAACVADALGLSPAQIARGISKLQPVEHRLELKTRGDGVCVIDDAYNANPAGSRAALAVLRAFPGRRVIVTPGMVELGEKEEALNRELGTLIAQSADMAVLVGRKHTKPIWDGLKDAGFDMSNVHTVGSLDESTALLGGILQKGDVVLYENDLPDNYSET